MIKPFARISSLLFVLLFMAACGDDDNGSPSTPQNPGTPSGDLAVVLAFPTLNFNQPVFIGHAGDGSDRLFVVEQRGTIVTFENGANPSPTLFLDLRDRVRSVSSEQGLLGLAFHPQFAQNGLFYVSYTGSNSQSVISSFRASGNTGVIGTETILLEVEQPFSNHNGGMIEFGPDGFLYIALGDGGGAGDPVRAGQDRSSLLGSILRIDVDNTANGLNYSIPAGNPFTGNTEGYREEIFAYGLRNPFRFSFDRLTGSLYAGDVGQNQMEEIDLIVNGGNYGWNTMEGSLCFLNVNCNTDGLTLPIAEYPHTTGMSVTGGYVYRGATHSELTGDYFYADFVSGVIFRLNVDSPGMTPELFQTIPINISSFGEDEQGELYMLDYSSGAIYTIGRTE